MLKHTFLYPEHLKLHATMIDFAGWEMPLHYGSQLTEHLRVRNDCGMFDVSHMGIIDLHGRECKRFLSKILANDIAKLTNPGMALYSCMLNSTAGVLDDLIVYFIAPNFYRLIVNAACTAQDLAWLHQHNSGYTINIEVRNDLALLALQGPNAISRLLPLLDAEMASTVPALKKFSCATKGDFFIARTGYTGEDGVEIILPGTQAEEFWRKLLQQGIPAIGLGARDTLRLEAGYNLYGMDMDETVTPYESNLAWTVALNPTHNEFIGAAALQEQQQGATRQLIALMLLEPGVLRHGQAVYNADGEIGTITSGTYSPVLKRGIALARVATPVQANYYVDIRGKRRAVQTVKLPFVKLN